MSEKEIASIANHLKKSVVVVVSSIYLPDDCISLLLEEQKEEQLLAIAKRCRDKLRAFYSEKNIEIINKFVQSAKIAGIIELSLAGWVWPHKSRVDFYGNIEELMCPRCGTIYSIAENKELCPKCNCKLVPNIESLTKTLEQKINKALRLVMTAETILVLGRTDVLLPGALIPWLASKYNEAKIIEISEQETSLTPFVNMSIRNEPIDFLKSLTSI